MQKSILCTVIIRLVMLFGVFRPGSPYLLTVDAYAEQCFFDVVEIGSKLVLTYEVSEGGFLDIGVKVVDPDGVPIYEQSRESDGKHTFDATKNGSYTYCFSNRMSAVTSKSVLFSMVVTEPADRVDGNDGQNGEEDGHKKLENVLQALGYALINIKHEQTYMNVRDKNHRAINELTNKRVVIWSFFELFVLLSTTISQIYYLKRFFEIKRIV